MFGTVGFVSKIQRFMGLTLDHSICFELSPLFRYRKWHFYHIELPKMFVLDQDNLIYSEWAG